MEGLKRRTSALERGISNLRPLLNYLAQEERRLRLCPLCRCEYVLEPHGEDCPYEGARDAVALFDTLSERV
jgi:hypothetical protein